MWLQCGIVGSIYVEFAKGLDVAKPDLLIIVRKIDRSNSGLLDHSIDRSLERSIIQSIDQSIEPTIDRSNDRIERTTDRSFDHPNQTPALTNIQFFKNFVLPSVSFLA